MTPRDAMILQIAAFALLVMMLTIMGGCTPEPKPVGEPICSDPAQRRIDYDFEYCEFKHRDVRSRASSPHEGFIA